MTKYRSGYFQKILWAFVIKDLRNRFRFRVAVLSGFFHPVLTMISFLVVYASVFMASDTNSLGFVDRSNYVAYLLTGFLAYSIFSLCWGRTSLGGDKVMLTLEGMLIAPVSRYFILMGKAVQAAMEIMVTIAIFIIMILMIHPVVNLGPLVVGGLALFLLFVILISFDFLVSALEVAHEGWAEIIRTYMPRALLILGAVYFPSTVIPNILKPLVYINPLFQATNLFRLAFNVPAELPWGQVVPFVYMLVLAIALPIVAVSILELIMKRWGIKGY